MKFSYLISCAALSLGLLSSPLVETSFAEDTAVSYNASISRKEAQRIVEDTWALVAGGIEATEANADFDSPKGVILVAIYGAYNTGTGDIVSKYNKPAFFKGIPEEYTEFISREAVERAALRFTGHKVTQHMPPDNQFKLTAKGYFCPCLGDPGMSGTPKVKKISQQGSIHTFTGVVSPSEPDEKPGSFSMQVTPGDQPGAWKRLFLKIKY